jgi:hypothetical protein
MVPQGNQTGQVVRRIHLVALFAAVFLLTLSLSFLNSQFHPLSADEKEYLSNALSGTYARYEFFQFALNAVAALSSGSLIAIRVFLSSCYALSAVVSFYALKRLFQLLGENRYITKGAFIGTMMYVSNPVTIYFSIRVLSEPFNYLMIWLVLYFAAVSALRSSLVLSCFTGTLSFLTFLSHYTSLFVLAFVLVLLLKSGKRWTLFIGLGAFFLIPALLYLYRNLVQFGSLFYPIFTYSAGDSAVSGILHPQLANLPLGLAGIAIAVLYPLVFLLGKGLTVSSRYWKYSGFWLASSVFLPMLHFLGGPEYFIDHVRLSSRAFLSPILLEDATRTSLGLRSVLIFLFGFALVGLLVTAHSLLVLVRS